MKKHNFTPEQSEAILNAVYSLKGNYANTYSYTQVINYLCESYIQNSFDEVNGEFLLKKEYFSKLMYDTNSLCDFFCNIEDALRLERLPVIPNRD